MRYTIQKMDGRFSYRGWFAYYIGFPTSMINGDGPLNFNRVVQWFTNTYGWSAEIRQYADMKGWKSFSQQFRSLPDKDTSDVCSPNWSWTNGYEDLRIYVASDQELSFFCLKYPVDQK